MTEIMAKKIFEQYNPADGVVRCPNGKAKLRKPLDLYAKAAVNLYGIIRLDEFAGIFNTQNKEQTTADEIYTILLPNVLKYGWYGFYKDYLVHYAVLHNLLCDSEEQFQKLFSLLVLAKNNTRTWENSGHTPNEMMNLLADKRPKEPVVNLPVKVGRNERCPCGSGKKYKNCCALIESSGAAQLPFPSPLAAE